MLEYKWEVMGPFHVKSGGIVVPNNLTVIELKVLLW